MKKIISIALSMVLLVAIRIPVFAAESDTDDSSEYSEGVLISTTQEERDAIFEKAMAEIMAETITSDSVARGPQYHYKAEYPPYEYKTLGGYAGNQVAGGYKFPTGGGFWFTDSGGPSVSGTFTVGLPKPYDIRRLGICFGWSCKHAIFGDSLCEKSLR